MNKKSILMVVANYPATHGHTTVINNLCVGLTDLGYRTAIGAFSFHSDPPQKIEKIKLSKSKLILHGVNYLDFDIIHSHQSRVNYYLLLRKPTKPIVLHYHGASNTIQKINFKLSMMLHKNKISKIISVSNAGISQMKKIDGSIEASVVYNGVDTNFYTNTLPQPFKKGEPQLLFVSALRKYKNTKVLINAMPKLLQIFPNAHLQIVGSGEDYDNLRSVVKQDNLDKYVELTGKVNDEELRLRYSSCDIYISASEFEVCPVPTLEAMASGKPLLLYAIEPHKEIIDISGAGDIFSSFEPDTIIQKISDVYKNKASYSNKAISFANSHTWVEICKQISNIYDHIVTPK